FLDRFAEAQHRLGRTWFQSLSWPSFHDTGFGAVTTEAYRAAGFTTLTVDQGFALFDPAPGVAHEPVLLPCGTTGHFTPAGLLGGDGPAWSTRPGTPAGPGGNGHLRPASAVRAAPAIAGGSSLAGAYDALAQVFSTQLKLAPQRIRGDVRFDEYGVD